MNDKIENIFLLPKAARMGILVGTILLIVAGYYFLVHSSIATEYEKVDNEVNGPRGLRGQVSQKEAIAKHLDKYKEEVKKLDGELKKALTELPDKKEIAQLLSRISDKARDAGLEIKMFKPQSEQKKDFYSEVPVEIEVNGTFHQVATFFDEVGRLERIVNLDQFGMTDPSKVENKVMLKTSVVATSFRFLDEAERPKPDDTSSSRKRRRSAGKKGEKEE